jgi:uncharacterized protein YhdP
LVRLAQVLVSLSVGLAILASLAAWRLSQGPISLNFMNPVLERSFAVEELSLTVDVEDTVMIWGGWRRIIDLRAQNLRILGPDGKLLASLPEVSVGISIRALAHFELAISRLEILGLAVDIERAADGRFTFQVPVAEQAKSVKAATVGKDTLDALIKPIRDGEGAFRYLRQFALIDGKFQLTDRKQDYVFDLPHIDIVAAFRRDGADTAISLSLDDGGKRTNLDSRLQFDRDSGRVSGRLEFKEMSPTLIGRVIPDLKRYSNVSVPVTGNAEFEFGRDWRLLNLLLDMRSRIGDIVLAMTYPQDAQADGGVVARLDVRNLQIAPLAEAAPLLGKLAGLDVPVSGRILGKLSADNQFELSEIDVTSGLGKLDFPGVTPQPLPVNGIVLQAKFSENMTSARIKKAAIDFGGPAVSATGAVQLTGGAYRVRADAAATKIPMATLGQYWPEALAKKARKWVTGNIVKGEVTEAKASMSLEIPADDAAAVRFESLTGTLQYHGLDVDYWAPLPRFTNVGGTGSFDKDRLRLALTSGRLRDVALEQSVIDISGFDKKEKRIAIDLVVRGALQTVLQVLNHESLALTTDLGILPKAVSGNAVIRTNLRFPLVENLTAQRVNVDVSATMREVALSPGPYGLNFSHGDLNLRIDNSGLTAGGVARLSATPVTFDWRENFKTAAKFRRRVVISGRVPELNRPGFGLPNIPPASGPADVSVTLTGSAKKEVSVSAKIALEDTRISIPGIGWEKASGDPGWATLSVAADSEGKIVIERIDIEAGEMKFSGAARRVESNGDNWRLDINKFRNGASDLTGKIDFTQDGRLLIAVSGKRFDLQPAFGEDAASISSERRKGQGYRPIRLDAHFDEVVWGDRRQLRHANIMAVYDGKVMQGLVVDGTLGDHGRLDLKFLPADDGQILSVTADDFGTLSKSVHERAGISGGIMVIRGMRSAPDAPLKGSFAVNRFKLTKAPMLARVLQVATLTGIVNALSKKGLDFEEFEGGFSYRDDRLTLTKVQAHGSSIGITVNGVIDFGEDKARLGGTIVPAYTLNRALSKVPVIGPLVTGGKNEGLFAANYRVSGPLDDPKVTVNPLSALAPGLLRKLFDLGSDDGKSRTRTNDRAPGQE